MSPVCGLIFSDGTEGYVNLKGTVMDYYDPLKRPATEPEILAEIAKNGWKLDHGYSSPLGLISISKVADNWRPSGWTTNIANKLNEFGHECIQAHRIITALNLVK